MSKTPMTLNVTEQQQLLDALLNKEATLKSSRKSVRNYLIGCLMLEAGLRVGEVVALKVSHLYFNSNPVQTLVLTSDITKSKKERSIPVSARLRAGIEEHYKENPWLEDELCSHPALATHPHQRPLTTRQVERIIRGAAMTALGRPVHPHMLRHTFASKLMRVTDMKTVSELLGHSDMTSTQIYCHPNEDDKKKAIESFNQPRSDGTVYDPSIS